MDFFRAYIVLSKKDVLYSSIRKSVVCEIFNMPASLMIFNKIR